MKETVKMSPKRGSQPGRMLIKEVRLDVEAEVCRFFRRL